MELIAVCSRYRLRSQLKLVTSGYQLLMPFSHVIFCRKQFFADARPCQLYPDRIRVAKRPLLLLLRITLHIWCLVVFQGALLRRGSL